MSANTHFPYPISLTLLPTTLIVCLYSFFVGISDISEADCSVVLLHPHVLLDVSSLHLLWVVFDTCAHRAPAVRPQCARSAKFVPIGDGCGPRRYSPETCNLRCGWLSRLFIAGVSGCAFVSMFAYPESQCCMYDSDDVATLPTQKGSITLPYIPQTFLRKAPATTVFGSHVSIS